MCTDNGVETSNTVNIPHSTCSMIIAGWLVVAAYLMVMLPQPLFTRVFLATAKFKIVWSIEKSDGRRRNKRERKESLSWATALCPR